MLTQIKKQRTRFKSNFKKVFTTRLKPMPKIKSFVKEDRILQKQLLMQKTESERSIRRLFEMETSLDWALKFIPSDYQHQIGGFSFI